MKVLFDQGTPAPLRQHLFGHEVATAHELNWSELKNGELVVLSHLPYKNEAGMKYDNRYNDLKCEDTGNYMLHGHLHGRYKKFKNMIDVGWDAHNKLLSEDEVIALINDPRDFIESPLTSFYEKRAKENLPNADQYYER